MTEWFDLEDKEFKELLRLTSTYRREALRCRDAKAYIAGCAVAGAALEAMMLCVLHLYGSEVEAAGCAPMAKGSIKRLFDWRLPEMLTVAAAMGWLPRGLKDGDEWKNRLAEIGDYAVALRQIRNLIHPARYVQDHSPSRVTKRYLMRSLEIFEVAREHLLDKVHESLRRAMEAEGWDETGAGQDESHA